MSDIALQIERISAGMVAQSGNIIFENTVISEGDVSYNNATGVITFIEPGRYIIDWWVATQSSICTNGAVFALTSSQGDLLEGNSLIKTGQVSGVGIIDVATAPVTVSLINASTAPVYYATVVPVTATLVVTRDEEDTAFGGLISTEGSVEVGLTPVTIIMDEQSAVSMNVDYSTPNAITILEDGVYRVDIFVTGNTVVPQLIVLSLNINGIPNSAMTQGIDYTPPSPATFCYDKLSRA
ncbi:MAG: hypothetical protein ACOYJD_08095 [Christensenellales bacterium]|jgi:hypothetical protein